jgi:hypothetical protein
MVLKRPQCNTPYTLMLLSGSLEKLLVASLGVAVAIKDVGKRTRRRMIVAPTSW